jgi:transcriptional regulator with XRE-family HTH domain
MYIRTGDAYMNKDLDEKKIGATIRRLRIRKKLPLEDIAAIASLSPISVRALELGRGSTLSTMLKVLKAIDEAGFILDWVEKSDEISPMQALRNSRRQAMEPKRVSRKNVKE